MTPSIKQALSFVALMFWMVKTFIFLFLSSSIQPYAVCSMVDSMNICSNPLDCVQVSQVHRESPWDTVRHSRPHAGVFQYVMQNLVPYVAKKTSQHLECFAVCYAKPCSISCQKDITTCGVFFSMLCKTLLHTLPRKNHNIWNPGDLP